jgi:ElaB/YqjD/DUF883 family membrane-anchored ribosome-binding protein
MQNRPSGDTPFQEPVKGIGDRAASLAHDAAQSISDVTSTAADKVNDGREAAADGLASAASTVHDRAEQLPGGPKIKQFAHATADRLSSTADYMRSHDATRIRADVESLVKDNPGPALAIAAAFGFLLGRALSRD